MILQKAKAPCKQCPFRKDSIAGYLGADSFKPDEFLAPTWDGFQPQPCHKTMGSRSERVCAGYIQFLKNNAKLPINPELSEMVRDIERDDSAIFGFKPEFIRHHKVEGFQL